MKTKYGDIHSIYNLFELLDEKENDGNEDENLRMEFDFYRCKICGDKIQEISPTGYCAYPTDAEPYFNARREHIELHKTLKNI